MPSEDRTGIALEAIRPRAELFHSALATTMEQIRGLLAGTGESPEDQTIALGNFASGHVDVQRFSAFTRQATKVEPTAELPIRAAQRALDDLLHMGDNLFVLKLAEGANLGAEVAERLKTIGNAFSAAHVADLAKRNQFREEKHAHLLDGLAYANWSQAERALAPGLVIELGGAEFTPAQAAPYLDAGLEAFSAWEGTAVAALLPEGAVTFVHDPAAGETTYERFTTLDLPKEIRKRAIGGISARQQAEDLELLEALAVVPTPTGEAASDPAGKLSAWLLSQTSLAGDG